MNRRDLGIAVLGAAAGIAGCSSPVQSLVVPSADAGPVKETGVLPNIVSAHWLRLRHLQVHSNFDIYLVPAHSNYWSATNTAPHVAQVDESHLSAGYFYVEAVGSGTAHIYLTGKGGESLSVRVEVA
ncbi:MAG TPA: hypothetical protein VNG31_01120 [Candidatus Baltobacteraceae bacterium]|nr:hypothetical protein [Candidatus Baltobacteraceae bacterium]